MELFIKEANNSVHPTIKFTAEISENEITFLDTIVFKGERFTEKSISKPTISRLKPFNVPTSPRATLQGVKRAFIIGEAIRLLSINSSKTTFEESLGNFKQRLEARGYPKQEIERSLSEVNFDQRQSALKTKAKKERKTIPFRYNLSRSGTRS